MLHPGPLNLKDLVVAALATGEGGRVNCCLPPSDGSQPVAFGP